MRDLIESFLDECAGRKRFSENTLVSYRRDLQQFCAFLTENQIDRPERANKTAALSYVLRLGKLGRSGATIARHVASVRAFYAYLVKNGLVAGNPMDEIKTPRVRQKAPEILTPEEAALLINQPDPDDLKGLRDRAMLELLYATGMTASELVALNLSDLRLDEGYLACGRRLLPFGRLCAAALDEYIRDARESLTAEPNEPALFVNMQGARMTRQGFWKMLKGRAAGAGLNKDVTPRALRHSFAMHLLENGADSRILQTMLGFSDMAGVERYARLQAERVKEVYQKAHPRA